MNREWTQLHQKEDVIRLLMECCRPLESYYNDDFSELKVGYTGAHYGDQSASMEGYARVLWGLGPLFSIPDKELPEDLIDPIHRFKQMYVEGLRHGTDPSHPGYWGEVGDHDQKMVEMAALAVSLCLAPDVLYNSLTKKEQKHVFDWMNQINAHKVHPNNWRFFRILVNMAFRKLGLPYSASCEKDDWEVIDHCYIEDGWYFDGRETQMDYYIPFAMHFYGLIYAYFMGEEDPKRSKECIERGTLFAQDFLYFFGDDGNEIPFGRSLTYRFAHVAFWPALAMVGGDSVSPGLMRHLTLSNMNRWFERPIFDRGDILTIGYHYPNLFMSERYNAPGSPYWAFKAFMMLALPKESPFWTAPLQTLKGENLDAMHHIEKSHMLMRRYGNHVEMFANGQHCMEHGNSRAKYEKFVYSNAFGFSISRGPTLEEGGFDHTIAFSLKDENDYRMRYGQIKGITTKDYTWTAYNVFNDMDVVSIIVPYDKWHIRIHRIRNHQPMDAADGGYSISMEQPFADGYKVPYRKINMDREVQQIKEGLWSGVYVNTPWGQSVALSMDDDAEALALRSAPNTHLYYNNAVIPTLKRTLEQGKHQWITLFGGNMNLEEDISDWIIPKVSCVDNCLIIDGDCGLKEIILPEE